MNTEIFVEPIARLRALAAGQAKNDRAELAQAYQESVAIDVRLTEAQRDELEQKVAEHSRWFSLNSPRLEALLPRTLPALSTYEEKRNLYRNQIASALHEAAQVSASNLFGRRPDGQRDPGAFKAVLAGAKMRLGQCRGYVGALDRCFLQIGVELALYEKRGFGLPPEPAPLADLPKSNETLAAPTDQFDPRRPYKK